VFNQKLSNLIQKRTNGELSVEIFAGIMAHWRQATLALLAAHAARHAQSGVAHHLRAALCPRPERGGDGGGAELCDLALRRKRLSVCL
jgi:hypothetical protein